MRSGKRLAAVVVVVWVWVWEQDEVARARAGAGARAGLGVGGVVLWAIPCCPRCPRCPCSRLFLCALAEARPEERQPTAVLIGCTWSTQRPCCALRTGISRYHSVSTEILLHHFTKCRPLVGPARCAYYTRKADELSIGSASSRLRNGTNWLWSPLGSMYPNKLFSSYQGCIKFLLQWLRVQRVRFAFPLFVSAWPVSMGIAACIGTKPHALKPRPGRHKIELQLKGFHILQLLHAESCQLQKVSEIIRPRVREPSCLALIPFQKFPFHRHGMS